MFTFFSIVHVILAIFMIFVILLQPGKDAGMGAALGGGAASSAFGGRGAVTFLTKVTAFCAIGFFITSLGLSFVGLRTSVAAGLMATPKASTTDAPKNGAAAPGASQGKPEAAPGIPVENSAPKPAGTEAVPAEQIPAK